MKTVKLIIAIMAFILSTGAMAQTNHNQLDREMEDMAVNLCSQDIAELHVHRTSARLWVTGVDQFGKPQGQLGVLQELEMHGIKGRVHLAEFRSEDDARAAAASYVTNMAAVFHPGAFRNATNKLVVDQSWYSRDGGNTVLLVRTGKTLALVSCRGGTDDQQGETSVTLAAHIADKVRSGKRVIFPQSK
jgi:hypothetical protein